MTFWPALALLVAIPTAWLMVGWSHRYAIRKALVDVPGARTSHARATPRGGGAGIAAVVLPGIALAGWLGWLDRASAIALVGGGSLVSAIGWLDDHKSLAPLPRVLTHIVAGAWFVGWAFGVPGELSLWLLRGAAAVAIAWCVNFYNFMDGIDGLAVTEAVFVCAAAGSMLLAAGATPLAWVSLLIALAAAAFVPWNWPPAKIFMGDVGSGLIGYMIASLALLSADAGALPLPVWLILISVFWFDATTTLFRRVARGERWYAAHRLHAYQRLVQSGWSHSRTTLAVLAVNIVVMPLALLAWRLPTWGWPAVALACLVLALAYAAVEKVRPMWTGAGAPLSGPTGPIVPAGGSRVSPAPVPVPSSRSSVAPAPAPSARHTVAETSL